MASSKRTDAVRPPQTRMAVELTGSTAPAAKRGAAWSPRDSSAAGPGFRRSLIVRAAMAVPALGVSTTSLTGRAGGLPAIVPAPGFVINFILMLDFVLRYMFHPGSVDALDRHAEPHTEPDLDAVPIAGFGPVPNLVVL